MTGLAATVKADFPILNREVNGHRLVYLDSAATAQKPLAVIEAVDHYYRTYNANVLRSAHTLADEATVAYEGARDKVARFINAPAREEVVFTRGTTESLNIVARCWAMKYLKPGDRILITALEHHSNLIPWQQVARRSGAVLDYIELQPDGSVDSAAAVAAVRPETRLVAISAASNVLGTLLPVRAIADRAHAVGAVVVVDGAQSVPHAPTDVQALGADFLAFSGHKMGGPTGIGILWGRAELLDAMDPPLYGGEMIAWVERHDATWAELPHKFEGGTPHIAGAIGLGAAVDYLSAIGMAAIWEHGRRLGELAYRRLRAIDGVQVYGPEARGPLVAFNVADLHPHDVAQVLDSEGVAARAGHHCAQPLMRWLAVPATVRASFYLYNDEDDLERLVEAIEVTKRYFRR